MPAKFNPIKIFAGEASKELGNKIAANFGIKLGEMSILKFKDGEIQPSFDESIRGCDVFIIQSTYAPAEHILELLLMIDAAKRASAHYINVVIPYYGYARQDRKDKPRVSIGAKLIADLIFTAGAEWVMTMDLHAAQIQGFFPIPVVHLDSSVIFIPYIRSLELDDLIIASPDIGGTKRAREFASLLNSDIVICDKHRKKANEVDEIRIIGSVKGKNVIIIDDMIDTGNTLMKAAEVMMNDGAKSIRAFATHPVFSDNAAEKLNKSVLNEVVVCDTIPIKNPGEKITVLSTAALFAKAIHQVYEHESISSLFEMPVSYQKQIKF
ncbi:MAG TPA: ribose-phosphate pyrophosphokinase [Bacteroidia bacterium]|nr:ribose-phosphate pyrophosphokinase [Sphingobacteriales bacterium]HPD66384.1 ribose-phosphate pyrophosphokinase [Bacteroidia bacterium]HRS60002.1 ribose-phosphate pyrophosphokinase [Bacteroidia bacterium]HRU69118.1 ribose-phosphate pyrophosphokinase [Bacteroidia bacterium]